MDWIGGVEALRVIFAVAECMNFMPPDSYPKVYKVLELGLKSELRS